MTLTDKVDPGYSFFSGTTAILPREEVEKGNFAANPVGLGPFKFKEWVPNVRFVAVRNPAIVLAALEARKDRDLAIELLRDAFDMLSEDFEEEQFYVAVRREFYRSLALSSVACAPNTTSAVAAASARPSSDAPACTITGSP